MDEYENIFFILFFLMQQQNRFKSFYIFLFVVKFFLFSTNFIEIKAPNLPTINLNEWVSRLLVTMLLFLGEVVDKNFGFLTILFKSLNAILSGKTVEILDEIFKFGWKIVAEGCTEFSWNSFPFNKKAFKILDWRAIDSVSQIAPLQMKNHY